MTPGTLYEYRVQLSTSSGTAYGYIASGIAVQTDGYQGRVALVVDQSQQGALAADAAGTRFVVRAIKRVTTAGGSYDLPSVGAVARTP